MSLESNPMLVMEFLEVIKESAVECKDKSDTSCVCIDDIKLDSLLYVINSAEEIIRKWADHERPQGEWISNYTSQFRNPGRQCSLCGKVVEFSENFCPNCGAYMRGNEHD